MSWLWWIAQAAASGLVLQTPSDRQLKRAVRIAKRADAETIEALDAHSVCVGGTEPSERLTRRLTRILGHPPEERLDCDVARFPLGRGWIAMVIEPPAETLEALIEQAQLPYVDVRRPIQGAAAAPIRVCVARTALREPLELARTLDAGGVIVRSTYEVGGCAR